jgi:hypothetical protein
MEVKQPQAVQVPNRQGIILAAVREILQTALTADPSATEASARFEVGLGNDIWELTLKKVSTQ